MTPVHQTDFTAARGNALQACVASIFDTALDDVPNFIEAPDYAAAISAWLEPRGVVFLKVPLTSGELPFATPGALCILAGPSPRGSHKHAVVARANGVAFEIVHDPHPDGTGLAGAPQWAGFFVMREKL